MAALRRGRVLAIIIAASLSLAMFSVWWLAGALLAPQPRSIGALPADLHGRPVRIDDGAGGMVAGWWIPGETGRASVLLLHGIRADRRAMLGRARILARHGHAVLLIDLPAHGESSGDAITLGRRESIGVRAARDWIRTQRPDECIAAIGVSLGGASILLGERGPIGFDAVVLEAVYSNARQAIRNRIAMRLGNTAASLSSLLEMQAGWRIGVPADALSPLARIGRLDAPVLIIAGGRDRHTRLWESRALYARAPGPKALWILPQAAHVDFFAREPADYEARVVGFIQRYAAGPLPAARNAATPAASNGQSSSAPSSSRRSTGTRIP